MGVADWTFQFTATAAPFVGVTLTLKARCASTALGEKTFAAKHSAQKLKMFVRIFMATR